MPVTVDIPLTKLWIKRLQNSQDALLYAADETMKHLKKNWSNEKDPEGFIMTPLTHKYAEYKQKSVGNRKINIKLTGDLQNSLDVVKKSNTAVTIGFGSDQQKKASGLAERRSFMEAGDVLSKKITGWVKKGLTEISK